MAKGRELTIVATILHGRTIGQNRGAERRINNRCPADRHGAYFWVDIWFMDGDLKSRFIEKGAGIPHTGRTKAYTPCDV
jgi:hypothetical protein